jgi:signal peptidase II
MDPMETRMLLRPISVAAAVLLIDQLMKAVVRQSLSVCSDGPARVCDQFVLGGPIRVLRLENAGSALGFLQGSWVWLLIAAVGFALIPLYAQRLTAAGWIGVAAIGLQAGGGLGNLADRVLFGSVTDFIDIGIGVAFNPADIALLLGMVLAFAAYSRTREATEHSIDTVPASVGPNA